MKIGACLEKAVEDLKANPAPFVIGMLAIIIPNAFLSWLAQHVPLVGAANWLVTTLLSAGMVVMAVKASRREPFGLDDLGAGFSRPVPFLVVNLAIAVGVIACGVGVLVTSFLFMYATIYVARGDDFGDALRKSKDIALANVAESLVLILTVFGLVLAGILACGIGLFVTAPLAILTTVHALSALEGGARVPAYRPGVL